MVKWVIGIVEASGGITYAVEKMKRYTHEALEILHQFPKTEVRDGLENLVHFVIDRKY